MVYSPPASSVHGIFQARILEWVAISNQTHVSCIGGWILYLWVIREIRTQVYLTPIITLLNIINYTFILNTLRWSKRCKMQASITNSLSLGLMTQSTFGLSRTVEDFWFYLCPNLAKSLPPWPLSYFLPCWYLLFTLWEELSTTWRLHPGARLSFCHPQQGTRSMVIQFNNKQSSVSGQMFFPKILMIS